jgi:hypothetical protein
MKYPIDQSGHLPIKLTPHKGVLFLVPVLCGDSFKCSLDGHKCLEGLSTFAIWWLLKVPSFKTLPRFLVFCCRFSGVRH